MVKPGIRLIFSALLLLLVAAVLDCPAQKPQLVVQMGHAFDVFSVAFSPDGKLLASGSGDNTVKLWDVATGSELRTFNGHKFWVESVAFSRDGQIVASGSADTTIKLWDVTTGRERRTLRGHTGGVNSIAFSPDGKLLASGGVDKTIKLWNLADSQEPRTLSGHLKAISSISFSPDGKLVASSSVDDQTVRLWSVDTGAEIRSLTTTHVWRLAFSPDGKILAGGSHNKTIELWDAQTLQVLRTLPGHSSPVSSVAFSPDGKTLTSGSWDKTIKVWDVASGQELRTLPLQRTSVLSIALTADGRFMATGNQDYTIKLWDVSTNKDLHTLGGDGSRVSDLSFSSDGSTLASGSWDKTIKLWDLSGVKVLRALGVHARRVESVAFSPDRTLLASTSFEDQVKLWNIDTGKELFTLRHHFPESATFSPDGKILATGSADKTVKLWDVATGKELRSLAGPPIPPSESSVKLKIVFSPDGKLLAGGGAGNTIKVWDVATGRAVRILTGHTKSVTSIAFSPDGKRLASASFDKTVKLWDLAAGQELRTLTGHSQQVSAVAFTPDGLRLASGSFDETIKFWDAATGNELQTLVGHHSVVWSIAFSPDGKIMASGSDDPTIKLWNAATGKELASLVSFGRTDWVVVTAEGRFDASARGMNLLHWVIGNEPIDLEQLKARYFEPGLLGDIVQGRPLPDVSRFENPKLYPLVDYKPPSAGSSVLNVKLTNRGGGIGRVQIFVNGKEFIADARDDRLKQHPDVQEATLNVDLATAPGTVNGKANQIRVVAWNVEGYISSRGGDQEWVAGGNSNRAAPEVYAIVGGISRYAGAKLNLNFAGKDAVDMANALSLGAKRLFGADKVHLTLLSTATDPRAVLPTKENFTKAFLAARQAKPTDILIVYLAGHGITLQRGTDTYCYLTQEARTSDVAELSDPEVRKIETITSEELVGWLNKIPALKQTVILDTCAAGAAQGQLKLIDKRQPEGGDAIRAIDRAKDRTGSHILMGSAADAVSYETGQYGQGLLTYALLKGMKGPALRDDELVDISKLFLFAREEVELLAQNIGGIQKPVIFAPRDETFDVGQLKFEDKEKIVLATPKPMILRPRFYEDQVGDDTLDLMKTVRALLRDESFVTARGAVEASLVFVDDEEFPGAIRPTGIYKIQGNTVSVALRLRRDGKDIGAAQVTGTKDNVATKLMESIKASISKL